MGDKVFDPVRTEGFFATCSSSVGDIPVEPFLNGCLEIAKLIGGLGVAMKMAEADVLEKVGVIKERAPEYDAACKAGAKEVANPAKNTSIQGMVDWEVARGVQAKNDSKYVSAARSVNRLMWFLDFVTTLLQELISAPPTTTLSAIAKTAYDKALAPHHPWLLRKTVGAGLLLLPSRENFLKDMAGPGGDVSNLKERLQAFLNAVEPTRKELWRFYEERKLTELP